MLLSMTPPNKTSHKVNVVAMLFTWTQTVSSIKLKSMVGATNLKHIQGFLPQKSARKIKKRESSNRDWRPLMRVRSLIPEKVLESARLPILTEWTTES
jgi:hypothetical protein